MGPFVRIARICAAGLAVSLVSLGCGDSAKAPPVAPPSQAVAGSQAENAPPDEGADFIAPRPDGIKHPAVIFYGDPSESRLEAVDLAKYGIVSLVVEGGSLPPEKLLRNAQSLASRPEVDPDRIAFVGPEKGDRFRAVVTSRYIDQKRVSVFFQYGDHDPANTQKVADEAFDKVPEPTVMRVYEGDQNLDDTAREDRREFLQHIFSLKPGSRESELSKLPAYFMTRLPLAYPPPPPSAVRVLPPSTYRTIDSREFHLDVYQPAERGEHPAVILVHGQTHPALLAYAKGWRGYQELARVLASKGYVAIVPNLGATATGAEPKNWFSRIDLVADNLGHALKYTRAHAAEWGVDTKRIGLWVASAGGHYGISTAYRETGIACVVGYYPLVTDRPLLENEPKLPAATLDRVMASRQLRRRGAKAPPTLLVRAGYDLPWINQGIDDFMKLSTQVKAKVTLLRHEPAHHGFEIIDATDESKAVLDQTFAFLDAQLRGKN